MTLAAARHIACGTAWANAWAIAWANAWPNTVHASTSRSMR
jgi:hypothetical protein